MKRHLTLALSLLALAALPACGRDGTSPETGGGDPVQGGPVQPVQPVEKIQFSVDSLVLAQSTCEGTRVGAHIPGRSGFSGENLPLFAIRDTSVAVVRNGVYGGNTGLMNDDIHPRGTGTTYLLAHFGSMVDSIRVRVAAPLGLELAFGSNGPAEYARGAMATVLAEVPHECNRYYRKHPPITAASLRSLDPQVVRVDSVKIVDNTAAYGVRAFVTAVSAGSTSLVSSGAFLPGVGAGMELRSDTMRVTVR